MGGDTVDIGVFSFAVIFAVKPSPYIAGSAGKHILALSRHLAIFPTSGVGGAIGPNAGAFAVGHAVDQVAVVFSAFSVCESAYARKNELKPSETVYKQWGLNKKGKKDVNRLRFSKSGDPGVEKGYSTHYVDRKRTAEIKAERQAVQSS